MHKQISLRTYQWIDIGIFALLTVLLEGLIVTAYRIWFPELPYTVSITGTLTAIVMIRWGAPAGLIALLGGCTFCFLSGAAPVHYLIYCVGNLFSLLMLLPLKRIGWERLRAEPLLCMLFGLGVVFLMQTGRACIALFLGNPLSLVIHFYLTDVISGLAAIVVMWIARRLDGILEDQIHYIMRQHKDNENTGGA